jgi:hypothetical protein
MTEEKWLTATDPATMLKFLKGKASERKLQLFACARSAGIGRNVSFSIEMKRFIHVKNIRAAKRVTSVNHPIELLSITFQSLERRRADA